MRVLVGLAAASLLAGTTAGRDDKPDLSGKLQGRWKAGWYGKGSSVFTGVIGGLELGDGTFKTEVDLKGLLGFTEGKIKVDAKADPGKIEFKSGDTVRKAIYRFMPKKDGKEPNTDALELVIGDPGADYPMEFPEGLYPPKDFKGIWLQMGRRKE